MYYNDYNIYRRLWEQTSYVHNLYDFEVLVSLD